MAPETRCTTLCARLRCVPRKPGRKKPATPTSRNTIPRMVAAVLAIISPFVDASAHHTKNLVTEYTIYTKLACQPLGKIKFFTTEVTENTEKTTNLLRVLCGEY